MARVIGIDPGTVSFDLCGLDDGSVFLDRSVPTVELTREPAALARLLQEAAPVELVAGPSGYGLPLTPIDRLRDRDLKLAYLVRDVGRSQGIGGLRDIVDELRRVGLPVVFTPGVIHLPTVPAYRKANRIDMGTADKVCTAALAIWDQARRHGLDYNETSLILAEIGGAFSAVIAVDGGQIVDGLGGSSGPMGYRALGAMDGELAYLLGRFPKQVIFSGGAAFIAGSPEDPPDVLGGRGDPAAQAAREALVESLVKAVVAEHSIVPHAREILLAGRLSGLEWLVTRLHDRLSRLAPIRTVEGFATSSSQAAQGAALLAEGLAGGARSELAQALAISQATGTALDYIHVMGGEKVQAWSGR